MVMGVNRNHPGCWGYDLMSAHGCVHRDIGAVKGPTRVFDCFSIALVVDLLSSFMGVVKVIAMGLSSGADIDESDSNQKRSNGETLSKRHSRDFD